MLRDASTEQADALSQKRHAAALHSADQGALWLAYKLLSIFGNGSNMSPADRAPRAIGLDLERIFRCYGSTTVIDGVSLAIAPGELVVPLASSACGKTTLLKIVAGFDRQTVGRALAVFMERLPGLPHRLQ